jgi:hypothetical protein
MRTKSLTALLFSVTGALLLAATPASAESSAAACSSAGGTYIKDGGTSFCQFSVGNSDNTKTVDQKGSFKSSHEEGLTNPGGTKPPGQQGGNRLP